jgi:hypothetical protein
MRLTYIGRIVNASGQIAWIDNYQTRDLLYNAPSVDDFFNRATKTARFGLDTYEQLFRPDESTGTDRFRGTGDPDPCLVPGAPGASLTTESDTVVNLAPRVFGFAWRGCDPGVIDHMVIETVKVMEWRTESTSGLTSTVPRALHTPPTSKILAMVDQAVPGWSSRIASELKTAAVEARNKLWLGIQTEGPAIIGKIGTTAAAAYLSG